MSSESPLSLCPFVASLKMKSDFIHIFNDFYMYRAPGQGQTTSWGQTFDVNRKPLSLCPFVVGLNKLLWILILYTFFHVSPYVNSPVQGQTIHWGQIFYDNRKAAFSLCPYVASFKLISSKSDFIHIFNDFKHVCSPVARAENPLGQTFDVNRKPLSFRPFVASFKQISLNSDFKHIFNVFQHVYSLGAGADNPFWTKSWYQQKGLVTLPICCIFQKIIFEVWFLYIIFHVLIHVYSPGARWEFLYKHKPFVTLVICCKFLPLNDFLTVFTI